MLEDTNSLDEAHVILIKHDWLKCYLMVTEPKYSFSNIVLTANMSDFWDMIVTEEILGSVHVAR